MLIMQFIRTRILPEGIEEEVFEGLLHKLEPCIERGELDACAEEAARLADELGIDAPVLLGSAGRMGKKGEYELAYVLALGAVDGLDNSEKARAYSYAGVAAQCLGNADKAETHHLKAIEIDPKLAEAHGVYGLLLIDCDKRNDALTETESASKLFKETGRITQSYLAKAWFYEQYSEKYFKQKEYRKSSDDLAKASAEYFEAAKTAEGYLIDNFTLQGNILKAKSFMRKIPQKPWYDESLRKLGIKPAIKTDISEFVRNLQNAAKWYQKASVCEVEGKKDVCTACHLSISVFYEVLGAMSAFIKNNKAEINKDKWLNSLEGARKTYADNESENGVALVDSLKQLVKCVDELAEQKAIGLPIQEERLEKCYNNLITVNDNLGGVLKVISDHATEAIRDYAKKEGMAGFGVDEKSKKTSYHKYIVRVLIAILGTLILGVIGGIIANVLSPNIVPYFNM